MFQMPGMDTPEGQGLLAAAFSLLQARKMPGDRGIGGALGAAGQQYMGTRSQAQDQMQRRKFQDLQMRGQQSQLDQMEQMRKREQDALALRSQYQRPDGFDYNGYAQALAASDPMAALDLKDRITPKPRAPIKLGEGEVLLSPDTYAPIAQGNPKAETVPELTRLIAQRDKLPEGSPFRKVYDDAIRKATTHQPGTNVSVNTGQRGFDNTLKLRGDFRSEPIYKAHQEVQSAYSQIQQGLKMASPAGDLAGATKIMKLLDPGSVVRESELGMAMAATGAMDRLENYAANIIKGTKLTPMQRKDFQTLADRLYGESVKQFNAKRSEYQGIAERNQLNVPDVVGSEVKPANNSGWGITRVP